MSGNELFCVFEKEPLLYFLHKKLHLNPVTLGLAFFIVISLSLTVFGIFNSQNEHDPGFISYMQNISWSVSLLVLFPFIVGLTLHYYLTIPKLFSNLAARCTSLDEQDFKQFVAEKQRWFNHGGVNLIFILLVIGLNLYYFIQLLSTDKLDWINHGSILSSPMHWLSSGVQHGFSKTGLFAAVIQIVLSYWIINLIWRSFILVWALYGFFNDTKRGSASGYRFEIPVMLLHPDGACGLKAISRIAMIFNLILFLLGIYISLKVVDMLIIQNGTLADNIGNPLFLFCYIFLAPLLFFLPLAAAHKRMRDTKIAYLMPLAEKRDQLILHVRTGFNDKLADEIKELDALYDRLNRSIPIWPFNFRSVEAFFIAIITPLLPAILPVITHFMQSFMN